jgi:hypothetical protein
LIRLNSFALDTGSRFEEEFWWQVQNLHSELYAQTPIRITGYAVPKPLQWLNQNLDAEFSGFAVLRLALLINKIWRGID